MRVHVLRNPVGRSAKSRRNAAQTIGRLRGLGHTVVELTQESAQQSSSALANAVRAGETERLLVAGGDGLVHLAIQHVAETSIPIVLAPTGTGNDFATALGITADTDLDQALAAPPVAVDLLGISGGSPKKETTYVASIAIAGFPANISARANAMRLPIGRHLYTVAAALELPRFRRLLIDLRVDDEPLRVDTAMLAIGNTSLFGGGMLACPDAEASNGRLHLTSIDGVGRAGVLGHLQGRAGGTADRAEVTRRVAKKIVIATPGIEIWGDGEPITTTPTTIEVVPGAVRIAGVGAR